MLFLDEFKRVIDAKQRLTIPPEVRGVLSFWEHGSAFVAAPGSKNLALYPEPLFKKIAEQITKTQDLQTQRSIFSQSARVPMDSANRVRIPDRLLKKYALSSKVVLVGMGDHLEVFEAKRWALKQEQFEPVTDEIWEQARQNVDWDQMNGNES